MTLSHNFWIFVKKSVLGFYDPELKYRVKLTGAELSVNLGRHLRHQKRGRQWQCSLDSDAPDPSHPWEWPPK